MKKRPLSIVLISLLYFLEPIGNAAIAAFVNDVPFWGSDSIWTHLIWSDWIIICLFPIVALGIYSVRKWGWYLFVGFSILLIGYNIFVSAVLNPNYEAGTTIFFIIFIAAITGVFIRKHVYSPYFNPRLRWWEVATRYRIALETKMLTSYHGSADCRVIDISKSGCFVDFNGYIEEGSTVWLILHCSDTEEINCLGRIVRRAVFKGRTTGYGILFMEISKENRIKLMGLLLALRRLGMQDRKGTMVISELPANALGMGNTCYNRLICRLGIGR